jgi:hypothetical protein
LIQANIPLRSENKINNEMEERKDENFELPEYPIPYPVPLKMEYMPKDPFYQYLEEPFEKEGVHLHIFHAAWPLLSVKKCFYLDLLKKFVEDSLPSILTNGYFAVLFIDQPIRCKF